MKPPTLGALGWLIGVGLACLGLGYRLVSSTIPTGSGVDSALASGQKIEVRNGCGERGLAAEIRRRLIDGGFDVVETTNADDFEHRHSVFVDLKGNLEEARELADLIGCSRVIQQIDGDEFADYAIIVGADHEELQWQN